MPEVPMLPWVLVPASDMVSIGKKCVKQQQQRQQQHHLSRAVARWDSEAANTRNTDSGKG
jgi:hypothetical protein